MVKRAIKTAKKSFLEYCLQWGVIALFAVLPLLYFPGRVASYVTSKEYFLIGTVDVLAVLWVWLIVRDSRYRFSRKNLLVLAPLFVFLLSLTVSAFVGIDSSVSFFSIVESGTGLILLYHAFLLACIVASLLRVQQKQLLKYIIQANLFASVVLSMATFLTADHGIVDIHSQMLDGSSGGAMMGNSLLAGAYFIFSIFLTLYLVTHESHLWKKVAYWCGIAVIVLSPIFFNVAIWKGASFAQLVSTGYFFIGEARVATVALSIGLLLALFIWLSTLNHKKVWRIVGIVGIVLMILAGGVGMEKISSPSSSLHTFFVDQAGNRLIDWQDAVQGIKERPLLGWGPENFHVLYQKYFNPVVLNPDRGSEAWALHPHNNTLEVAVSGGLIGLLLYLAVLASLFGGIYDLYKKRIIDGKTLSLFIGMLVAFIIQQQMIYDSIVSYTMFFFAIAIVAGLSDSNTEARQISTHDAVDHLTDIGIVLLFFPIWLYAAYLPARKTEEMQQVGAASSNVRIAEYQDLFHGAGSYAVSTDPEFYTDPLYYSYFDQKDLIKSNPMYQKVAGQELQSLTDAIDPLWQNNYYDYHLTLSLVQLENLQYYLTGNPSALAKADIYAKRGFALAPADPQIYTVYAQTLVYEHNNAGALILINEALALNPVYQSAIDFKNMLMQ